jgi:molybdate transport system substrate-binding protein
VVLLALAPILLSSCGGGGGDVTLTVYAASSLAHAFPIYAENVLQQPADFTFGGSDQLATQIQNGASPDLFASADTRYPQRLHETGLVGKPVDFAANSLVVAAPEAGSHVDSLSDLAKPGLKIAIGKPGTPIGDYTREVLDRLPDSQAKSILDAVAYQEPDAAAIVDRVTGGEADAGFVYSSDVKATAMGLEAVELPDTLQPDVTYAIAVVSGAAHPDEAQAFVDGLRSRNGQQILHENGFLRVPDGNRP